MTICETCSRYCKECDCGPSRLWRALRNEEKCIPTIQEEKKMDKNKFVTMLYSIQERVQIITERLEDDHAIQEWTKRD